MKRYTVHAGDCRDVLVMKSQAEKYPNADLGVPAERAAHYKCARGIQLWFHAFSVADQGAASLGIYYSFGVIPSIPHQTMLVKYR